MNNQNLSILDTAIFAYENWREGFLRSILRVASVAGLPLLIIAFPQLAQPVIIAYIIVYVILLAVTFAPIPYTIRAAVLLAIMYIISLVTTLGGGINSDASMFFLGFVGMACLIFEYRIGIVSLAGSVITLLIIGSLMTGGQLLPTDPTIPVETWGEWILYSMDLLFIGAVIIFAIYTLKAGFYKASQHAHQSYNELQSERNGLEIRIQERTAGLAKQTEQLRAISHVTRHIANIQDIRELFDKTVALITEQFGYYHVGLFIPNESGSQVVLQSASSEGGKRMAQRGYRVNIGSHDPIAVTVNEKRPSILLDVGENKVSFQYAELPNTRSQITLPLIIRDDVIGVMDIHSTEPRAFSQADLDILISLADQIAVSIENVRLINETMTMVSQLENVTSSRTGEAWKSRLKEKRYAYTYTPVGVRPEKQELDETKAGIFKSPIILRGYEIGSISLTKKTDAVNKDEAEFVKKIAGQVSLAADNLRLLEEAQTSAQRDQILSVASSRIRGSLDMDAVLKTAVREFQRAMNLKEVEIRLGTAEETKSEDVKRMHTGTLSLRPRNADNEKKAAD